MPAVRPELLLVVSGGMPSSSCSMVVGVVAGRYRHRYGLPAGSHHRFLAALQLSSCGSQASLTPNVLVVVAEVLVLVVVEVLVLVVIEVVVDVMLVVVIVVG